MSSTNTLRRSRWSWFAVLATAIVCACGGGHDATTGPETLHKEAYASGDLGTCPVVQLTATGTGTTTTTSRYDYHYGPNGHEELFLPFLPQSQSRAVNPLGTIWLSDFRPKPRRLKDRASIRRRTR
jgi:hypothetical protein